MSRKTKIILSVIGACAIIVPMGLLFFASSRTAKIPEVSSSKRPLDAKVIEDTMKRTTPNVILPPTGTPQSSPSATPKPASGSANPN